jgi:hypothetical protein
MLPAQHKPAATQAQHPDISWVHGTPDGSRSCNSSASVNSPPCCTMQGALTATFSFELKEIDAARLFSDAGDVRTCHKRHKVPTHMVMQMRTVCYVQHSICIRVQRHADLPQATHVFYELPAHLLLRARRLPSTLCSLPSSGAQRTPLQQRRQHRQQTRVSVTVTRKMTSGQ